MLEMIALLAMAGEEGRFFGQREVDFWNARRRTAEAPGELWSDSAAPPPVRRLLEAPTAPNARAYLAWQEERITRLRAAISAVDAARATAAPSMLYFARDGCRWCALQEQELQGLPVVRVEAGSPLWKEYGVTVTPTLIVGAKVLRGYTPREALLREMNHD
jgi:hypothetical protein